MTKILEYIAAFESQARLLGLRYSIHWQSDPAATVRLVASGASVSAEITRTVEDLEALIPTGAELGVGAAIKLHRMLGIG